MSITFHLRQTDAKARVGTIDTSHGSFETPIFMPVGTQATVKGLTPEQLRSVGARIILGNTYHLALRPGDELIADLGGLHPFMSWDGPILTDSGGFQVFSLASPKRRRSIPASSSSIGRSKDASSTMRKITDEGAIFRSHIDGSLLELTPEKAVRIQENLGSDIAMVLDECPPGDASPEVLRNAVRRTILWAERSRNAHSRTDQALFAIVQGGTDIDLRQECARALIAMDFPGYALGGFSVGEGPDAMQAALEPCAECLPENKPRYLMGVGRPEDLLAGIAAGIDLFDCVMPTRNGRNALAFTVDGPIRLRNACHRRDSTPVESDCPCYACRNFSRAYLHHLFHAEEMLGPILLSLHNLGFYLRLMEGARHAIAERRYASFRQACLVRWERSA